jgi:hypothetical protein
LDALDLLVEDVEGRGIFVADGSTTTLTRAAIRDVGGTEGTAIGPALQVVSSSVTARVLTVERTVHAAVVVDRAVARFEELHVAETRRSDDGPPISIFAWAATVSVDRMHVTTDGAVHAVKGASVDVDDLVYEGSASVQSVAHAVVAARGGRVHVRRAIVKGANRYALFADEESRLMVEDVEIAGVRHTEDAPATGVLLNHGSSIGGTRLHVHDIAGVGIRATATSAVALDHLTVEGVTRHEPGDASTGHGLQIENRSSVNVARALLGCENIAISATGSTVTLEDIRIDAPIGGGGITVAGEEGSSIEVRLRRIAVQIEPNDGAPIDGTGWRSALSVLGVGVNLVDLFASGAEPYGIVLEHGTPTVLQNVFVERVRGTAVHVNRSNPSLTNLRIAGTRAGDARSPGGLFLENGKLELNGFEFVEHDGVPAFEVLGNFADARMLTAIARGSFSDNRADAVLLPTFDLANLSMREVFFRGNERDIEARER